MMKIISRITTIVASMLLFLNGINAQPYREEYKLMNALKRGEVASALVLVRNVDNVNYRDGTGRSLLWYSSSRGYLDVCKILINNGADVNLKGPGNRTALMAATETGHTEVVRLLVDNRAKLDERRFDGATALLFASQNGHTDIVGLLLKQGAKYDLKRDDGVTALMAASENDHAEVVRLLSDQGAKLNVRLSNGMTPLMLASYNGNTQVVSVLIEKGAKLELTVERGRSALSFASVKGHLQIVKLLLENGANIDLQDTDGATSLMLASLYGHQEAVEMLIKKGANLDLQGRAGYTALSLASQVGQTEIVKLLLENGADFGIERADGSTALTLAIQNGYLEIEELLREAGAYQVVKEDENTPLLNILKNTTMFGWLNPDTSLCSVNTEYIFVDYWSTYSPFGILIDISGGYVTPTFDDFDEVIGSDNTIFLNKNIFTMGLELSGCYKKSIAAFRFEFANNPLSESSDNINMELNFTSYALSYRYSLIDSRRFILQPEVALKLFRFRLMNSDNEKDIPVNQYMDDRDLDLRFNQALGSLGLRLSYKIYYIPSSSIGEYMYLSLYGGYLFELTENPWVYSRKNRLTTDKTLDCGSVTVGLSLGIYFDLYYY